MDINHLVTVDYSREYNACKECTGHFQLPYDEAPFSAAIQPGEAIKLYGGIEITNHTEELCHITVRFDLHNGFIATIEGGWPPVHFDVHVPMHSQHAIVVVNGGWELVAKNTIVD